MSTREFWNEEPELLWAYRKSYMDKLEIERELSNYNAWLNGLYVFEAVSKSLYNSFGRKETEAVISYAERPFDFKEDPKETARKERLKVEEKIKERNREIQEILKKTRSKE